MLKARWSRIVLFLLLTYAFNSIFYVRIMSAGKLEVLPVLGLMWCPGVSALILRLALQRNLRGIGWSWHGARWQVAYLLPPVVGLAVYGSVWISGIGGFNATGFRSRASLLITLGFVQGAVFALGEEIGWRGYLVPELARISSFTRTGLISGVAWSVYHYPLILCADYNSGTSTWFALLVFTWMVVASSFVYAWLRLKSGSLWPAVILHASHNLYIQDIFDPLTQDRGITKYVTTEFGIGLAVAYTAVACYFWKRRREVQTM